MLKLGLVILVCLPLFIIGTTFVLDHDVSYTGSATFQTEQGYTEFKEAVSDAFSNGHGSLSKSEHNHITVLSSSPPIIANFDLLVDTTYHFPYGERGLVFPHRIALAMSIIGGIGAILLLSLDAAGWRNI